MRFDFLVEVYRNGNLIGFGQLNDQAGGSSGFNNAILRTVAIIQSQPANFGPGDQLSVKLSVRCGPTGHVSGIARLWYNDAAADSRFDIAINNNPSTFYLSRLRNGQRPRRGTQEDHRRVSEPEPEW